MGITEVAIDERGRITIPNEERKKLQLVPGTKLIIEVKNDTIILRKSATREDFILEFCGIIRSEENEENLKKIWVSTDE